MTGAELVIDGGMTGGASMELNLYPLAGEGISRPQHLAAPLRCDKPIRRGPISR
jgi:hypothetical protein